jgi:hypothetical protein
MSRCSYCRKQGTSAKTAVRIWNNGRLETMELAYCSDPCKQNIHAFVQSHNQYAPKFMVLAMVWILLFLGVPFILQWITGNPIYVAVVSPVMLALMGAVLIRYPLGIVTTQYYKRLGIKYTTLFIRLTGLFMLMAGISIIWKK